MIVLDTNVVSEPLKPSPDPAVLAWLNAQAPETLYLTAINLAELLAGIEALPKGRRQTGLRNALTNQLLPLFEGRVLPFDEEAAVAFAGLNSRSQAAGNTMSFADAAIAAIALSKGFILATRNVRDFKHCGIELLDPWAS